MNNLFENAPVRQSLNARLVTVMKSRALLVLLGVVLVGVDIIRARHSFKAMHASVQFVVDGPDTPVSMVRTTNPTDYWGRSALCGEWQEPAGLYEQYGNLLDGLYTLPIGDGRYHPLNVVLCFRTVRVGPINGSFYRGIQYPEVFPWGRQIQVAVMGEYAGIQSKQANATLGRATIGPYLDSRLKEITRMLDDKSTLRALAEDYQAASILKRSEDIWRTVKRSLLILIGYSIFAYGLRIYLANRQKRTAG